MKRIIFKYNVYTICVQFLLHLLYYTILIILYLNIMISLSLSLSVSLSPATLLARIHVFPQNPWIIDYRLNCTRGTQ